MEHLSAMDIRLHVVRYVIPLPAEARAGGGWAGWSAHREETDLGFAHCPPLFMRQWTFPVRHAWQHFWFRPVTADGFGMMRIAFGLCALTAHLLQMPHIWYYYSDKGIFPPQLGQLCCDMSGGFLLDFIHTPLSVSILYSVLIAALVCVTIGIFTRGALLVTAFLLFSFREYSIVMLDGSDTILRLVCFILLLAPSGRAFSLESALSRASAAGRRMDTTRLIRIGKCLSGPTGCCSGR